MVDRPNERSLHATPKPRLGGVGLVVTASSACAFFSTSSPSLITVLGPAILVAVLGICDDVFSLTAGLRFLLQGAAAAVFLALHPMQHFVLLPGLELALPPVMANGVLLVWIVGALNIYNFMDGMDGLAGAQMLFASFGQAALLVPVGSLGLAAFVCSIGASSTGFLLHNFPPSRMFMGDAGSTFAGFSFAALAALGMDHGLSLAQMALPFSPFLLDGTFTLLRRALRHEPIWKAHRSHLYQRAVQTSLDHRDVLMVYVGWMAVAVVADLALGDTLVGAIAAWCVSLGCLGGVWFWVSRRESERAGSA